MRDSVERMLRWFVPISFVAFVLGSLAFALHGSETLAAWAQAAGLSVNEIGVYIKFLQSFVFVATNFVVGMWLWFQPHSSLGKRSLWSLFGIVSGLWALALWLLLSLLEPATNRAS